MLRDGFSKLVEVDAHGEEISLGPLLTLFSFGNVQQHQKYKGNQERELWRRFGRLIQEGDGKDMRETREFWRRVSLQTQTILDACMESAQKDGKWVEVAIPGA